MFFQIFDALLRFSKLLLKLLDLSVRGSDRITLRGLRENFVSNESRESEGQDEQYHAHRLRRLGA